MESFGDFSLMKSGSDSERTRKDKLDHPHPLGVYLESNGEPYVTGHGDTRSNLRDRCNMVCVWCLTQRLSGNLSNALGISTCQGMLTFTPKHTRTQLFLLQLTALCVCVCVCAGARTSLSFVCQWQVYCSRAAASCVSFSQRVCFLSCRFQSILGCGVGVGSGAFSSCIYPLTHTQSSISRIYTQSPQSYFLSKQTQYSSEKQTLFYVWGGLKENTCRATTFIGLDLNLLWAGWICTL